MESCDDGGVTDPLRSPARRAVTQDDVARAVGVSRTLVSFAFRGAPGVSESTRQEILAAAQRMGYRHNTAAANLAAKHRSAIGLYLLDLLNEVYGDVFTGFREALGGHPNPIVLGVAEGYPSGDDGAVDSLVEARVGVIVAATLLQPDAWIHRLAQLVPVVSVARAVPGVDSVYSDDYEGGRIATLHLLGLGHRRILHIAGPEPDRHDGRREAFEATMRAAGLAPRTVTADDFSMGAAELTARRALAGADRPTAVFAHDDQMALGVREAAHAAGLAIPQDVSLVGYDDSRLSALHGIDMTSVDLRARELGHHAGIAALARLRDPEAPAVDRSLQPRLVVRRSTAAPHK